MAGRSNGRDWKMRHSLAMEAARILAESGNRDYYAAKRKAATHLGAVDTRNMPSNAEIEQALMEYLRLFQADRQPEQLRQLRAVAAEAMAFFAPFSARLVGPVLNGTAHAHSVITLHVFADTPEDVGLHLMQHHIPYQQAEARLRMSTDGSVSFPTYRFVADDTRLEVIVFPRDGERQSPLSPVDGRPMRRATLDAVQALVAEDARDVPADQARRPESAS